MIRKIIAILILVLLPLTAWGDSSRADYDRARASYYALQDSQTKKLYRHNWQKTVVLFDNVHKKNPEGAKAADALYMAGKTSMELYTISGLKEDARAAVGYLDRLAQLFPDSSLADDALDMSAKIHETILDEPIPAYRRYQQIITDYPRGDMQQRARSKVKELARYTPQVRPSPTPTPTPVRAESSDSKQLRSIKFWSNPGYTRIVLDIGQAVKFTSNFLKGDLDSGRVPRIYVDLEQTAPGSTLTREQSVNDGLLKRIRAGQPDPNTTRVVLDIESFRDYKIVPYEEPFRIVIDVYGEEAADMMVASISLQAESGSITDSVEDSIADLLAPPPKETPLKVHIPESRIGGKLRRIVVDAGHGGRDPGAIGPRGIKEKDVVLAQAKILAKSLEKNLGCEVILTRTGDTYLQLEERTAIANKVKADLFISIHANASNNRNVRGIETYYLNFSKNAQAVEVVARENKTSLKQVGDLEMILLDLLANSKINESSRLAAEIQNSLVSYLYKDYKVKDLGVKQGPFYVLLGATMPSVLVETAFISHHEGEKRLTNRKYQEQTADAIVSAVRNYATALNLLAAQ
ncbi:MAG: N-acetylmuramoyl-L-alanine amidase [Desulfuromonadales bacterium]|nr:N-acetylmuramoyl-L-alanine amidase [Desulfuromonadales bacterium]